MTVIYLDFDGTLVDVRRRHYAAYVDTLRELDIRPLSEREYWERRREGAATADLIGEADAAQREQFLERWVGLVESPSYVRLDTLIPGARATLAALRRSHELVLVTLRRDRDTLDGQLKDLALDKFLSAVHHRIGTDDSKARIIRAVAHDERALAIVVGDSEADVEAAKELGMTSVCVTSGVRSRRFLSELEPDQLIPSVTRLPDALPAS